MADDAHETPPETPQPLPTWAKEWHFRSTKDFEDALVKAGFTKTAGVDLRKFLVGILGNGARVHDDKNLLRVLDIFASHKELSKIFTRDELKELATMWRDTHGTK